MPEILPTIFLPPDETVQFFRAKGSYPISRHWWDLWQEEHARAFTVAGILDRSVLEQLRGSLDTMLSQGGTFEMWKAQILPNLRAAVENGTAPLNILTDGRMRIIYEMNLRMARAAGKWKRIQALKARAPFLMYSAIRDGKTRPLHRLWGGLDTGRPIILHADHPLWMILFPPNGWGCRCNVIQLSQRDLDQRGLRVTTDDELTAMGLLTADGAVGGDMVDYVRADGVVVSVQRGIDPGFGYNVGEAHMRGLVPIPAEGPIFEPIIAGTPLPEMPPSRDRPSSLLLPKDAAYDAVIAAFMEAFGPPNSAGAVVVNDVLGETMIIDESFFYRGGIKGGPDTEKLTDSDRRIYVRLMAETLRDPDEVWYVWEDHRLPDGTMTKRLSRRYIARFTIDGKPKGKPIIGVVAIGSDGWKGITAFPARSASYIRSEKVRGGVLAYRRQ